ncbi:hypothetical protein ACIBK9_33720 [Nonomuraea sp. NPDC050227]
MTEIDFTDWGNDVSVEPPPQDQVHERNLSRPGTALNTRAVPDASGA